MKLRELRRFRRALRHFERLTSERLKNDCCCRGVSLAQCHTLLEIEQLKQTTTRTLSERMRLNASTLSRTVDGLVGIGLVQRSPHPSDRRITLLSLTEHGERTCERLNRANDRYYGEVMTSIPEAEREALVRSLENLVAALMEHQPAAGRKDNAPVGK